jgi:hypothetical protein
MRVVQVNIDRGKGLTLELRDSLRDKGIGVLLIQEPYHYKGKLRGFGLGARVFTGGGTPWAAVVVLDDGLGAMRVDELSNSHCVVVELLLPGRERVYVASLYCQFSEDPGRFLDMISRIRQRLRGSRIVLGVDANAHSQLWGGDVTDDRGILFEGAILDGGWRLLNRVEEGPTYEDGRGRSTFIDLTLSKGDVDVGWSIMADWSLGFHKCILLDVRLQGGVRQRGSTGVFRLGIKGGNWTEYRSVLSEELGKVGTWDLDSRKGVVSMVKRVHRVIMRAAGRVFKRTRSKGIGNRWWDAELTAAKKAVYAARRNLKAERDPSEREVLLRVFRGKRRTYKGLIREKEKASWEEYVVGQMRDNTWGVPYKLAVGKIRPSEVVSAIGEGTLTWEESARTLLDELVLDDSCEGELDFHEAVRDAVWRDGGGWEKCSVGEREVEGAVRRARKGKAPGLDQIRAEFIQEGWDVLKGVLTRIFNGCLRFQVFPNCWKRGDIRALLKGEGKNPGLGRSYRPICLLSALGKIFERLIVDKLDHVFNEGIHGAQYGFMRGRSTEDAILEFRRLVEAGRGRSKYVLGVFIDMTGAFDRVWWPGMLEKLRLAGVRGDLFGVVKDYLRGRYVSISNGTWEVGKRVNRGCPQGSILGPQMWKLVVDGLLRRLGENFGVVAYADDIVIIIEGKSRVDLVDKGRVAAGILDRWCGEEKMLVSKEKTVAVLLKGGFHRDRMPRLDIGGARIRFEESFTYLGVVWDNKLRVGGHVTEVTRRAYNRMMGVIRIMGNKGVDYTRLLGVYTGMYLAMVTYAAGAWGDRLTVRDRRKLLSEQRTVGLRMIKGYRTLSGEAVRVIGGLIPLDLEIDRRWVSKRVQIHGECSWEGKCYSVVGLRGALQRGVVEAWQKRWETSTLGRWTAGWWDNVGERLEASWIQPAYYVTQFLGGHGDFNGKLREFGSVRSGTCRCGDARETVEHVLFDCGRWERERAAYKVSREGMRALVSKQGFRCLQDFAEAVLGQKERE